MTADDLFARGDRPLTLGEAQQLAGQVCVYIMQTADRLATEHKAHLAAVDRLAADVAALREAVAANRAAIQELRAELAGRRGVRPAGREDATPGDYRAVKEAIVKVLEKTAQPIKARTCAARTRRYAYNTYFSSALKCLCEDGLVRRVGRKIWLAARPLPEGAPEDSPEG